MNRNLPGNLTWETYTLIVCPAHHERERNSQVGTRSGMRYVEWDGQGGIKRLQGVLGAYAGGTRTASPVTCIVSVAGASVLTFQPTGMSNAKRIVAGAAADSDCSSRRTTSTLPFVIESDLATAGAGLNRVCLVSTSRAWRDLTHPLHMYTTVAGKANTASNRPSPR